MSKYRILLIDKDPTTTKYLTHALQKADFEVFSANNSKEGLILAYQNRPHVIILDPNMDFDELENLLKKFKKDRRVARTKVIAFSSLTNPQDIQSAINLGLHEYIAKEGNALPVLIEKAKNAAVLARQGTGSLHRQRKSDEPKPAIPEPAAQGKLVVFLSSKGGVGTSSLCANIANLVNRNQDKRVIVADLVLPIGSISTIVGKSDSLSVVEASKLSTAEMTAELLKEKLKMVENWNFRLLAGSTNPEESNSVDVSRIPVVLDSLRKTADYVFVDLGKSLSRISLPIIKSADQIVITFSLDKATVVQTKAVWQYLQNQGISKEQVYFLINRAVSLEGLSKSEAEEELGLVIPLAISYMGRNFTLSNNLNQPIGDKFPQDAVTISLRQAGDEISRRIEEGQNTKITDFF